MKQFALATLLATAGFAPLTDARAEPLPATTPAEAATPRWRGTSELGLASSSGNTDSQTVNGKFSLAHVDGTWKQDVALSFLYGKQDDVESAYRYGLSGNAGRRVGDRHYVSGAMRTERDHFATYEYQSTASLGYGFEAIRGDTTQLTVEIGPGYRWSKLQDQRIHENGVVARGHLAFGHKLNDATSVYDTLLIESGVDNTFTRNDLGLKVRMTDALALKAGLELRHNSNVQPGTRTTDTLTTVNIIHSF